MCERVSMPRGCPPCCLFVLIFLTIKPQGHKKKFIEEQGRSRKWEEDRWDYYMNLKGQLQRISWMDSGDDYSSGVRHIVFLTFNTKWRASKYSTVGCNFLIQVITSSETDWSLLADHTAIKPHCVTESSSQVSWINWIHSFNQPDSDLRWERLLCPLTQ